MAFDSAIGVRQRGGSGENGVWQQAGGDQGRHTTINNNPLRWTVIRQCRQQEGGCNNQIELEYVRGEWGVDDTQEGEVEDVRQAGGRQHNKREKGECEKSRQQAM